MGQKKIGILAAVFVKTMKESKHMYIKCESDGEVKIKKTKSAIRKPYRVEELLWET